MTNLKIVSQKQIPSVTSGKGYCIARRSEFKEKWGILKICLNTLILRRYWFGKPYLTIQRSKRCP